MGLDLGTNTYKSLNPFPILKEEAGSLDGPCGEGAGRIKREHFRTAPEQPFFPLTKGRKHQMGKLFFI